MEQPKLIYECTFTMNFSERQTELYEDRIVAKKKGKIIKEIRLDDITQVWAYHPKTGQIQFFCGKKIADVNVTPNSEVGAKIAEYIREHCDPAYRQSVFLHRLHPRQWLPLRTSVCSHCPAHT